MGALYERRKWENRPGGLFAQRNPGCLKDGGGGKEAANGGSTSRHEGDECAQRPQCVLHLSDDRVSRDHAGLAAVMTTSNATIPTSKTPTLG